MSYLQEFTQAMPQPILISFILSYLIGSISFGLLITKGLGLGNLRNIGSGNIGATNVLRTGHKLAAFGTLFLDGGKGFMCVFVIKLLGDYPFYFAALGVFLGHLFPIYYKFKGGKGVATFIGVIWAMDFFLGFFVSATWLIFAIAFRISSLSALVCSAVACLMMFLESNLSDLVLILIISTLLWYKHRRNIVRLIQRAEPKIRFSKKNN